MLFYFCKGTALTDILGHTFFILPAVVDVVEDKLVVVVVGSVVEVVVVVTKMKAVEVKNLNHSNRLITTVTGI